MIEVKNLYVAPSLIFFVNQNILLHITVSEYLTPYLLFLNLYTVDAYGNILQYFRFSDICEERTQCSSLLKTSTVGYSLLVTKQVSHLTAYTCISSRRGMLGSRRRWRMPGIPKVPAIYVLF